MATGTTGIENFRKSQSLSFDLSSSRRLSPPRAHSCCLIPLTTVTLSPISPQDKERMLEVQAETERKVQELTSNILQFFPPEQEEKYKLKHQMTKEVCEKVAKKIIAEVQTGNISDRILTKDEQTPRTIAIEDVGKYAFIHIKERIVGMGSYGKSTNSLIVDLTTLNVDFHHYVAKTTENLVSPLSPPSSPYIQSEIITYDYFGRKHGTHPCGAINRRVKVPEFTRKTSSVSERREGNINELDQYIKSDGSHCNYKDRLVVALHTAKGLRDIHKDGKIHRDINMGNILFDEDNQGRIRAFVADFDTLMEIPDGLHVGYQKMVGTIGFMDPEMISKGIQTPATDRYAYGSVLQCLFKNYDLKDSVIKNLISQLHEKDPDERPEWDEVIDELENELQQSRFAEVLKEITNLGNQMIDTQ